MNDLFSTIRKAMFVPIHPAGWPFIAIFAVVALVLALIHGALGAIGLVLTLWCVYFFRNPVRTTPVREGLIVSPADGMVQMIVETTLPPELDDCKGQGDALCDAATVTRVSVFLNVFDVHVNRIPADGEIRKVVYHPGKFFNASLDKASLDNERSTVLMKLNGHHSSIAFVQIAGLVARRIICKLAAGQSVQAGELYGLIRFGSRVDIFLPPGVNPLVSVGQRMIGGETVIADFTSHEAARTALPAGVRPMELQAPQKKLPIQRMIPNMITLAAMSAGMTAIKFAIAEKWELAVAAIIVAALMDAFDGAAARLLKVQSALGAELDSFSDNICFGVAPALVMYLWVLDQIGRWGWAVALIFAMAVVLRLSRFNIATDVADKTDPLTKYFTGVPSPLGAALGIMPLILSFQFEPDSLYTIEQHPKFIAFWMLIVAAMMVSNIPTFSTKQLRISYKMKLPALALFGIIVAGLINDPWPTVTTMALLYLFMLPFGVQHYNKKEKSLRAGVRDIEEIED